jgi:hypothetical protein
MLFKAISASVCGLDAHPVQVEGHVGTGRMEDFNVVGLSERGKGEPVRTVWID